MAVTQPTNRWEYDATAGQTQFPYTRKIFAATDLLVFANGILKAITTDYTVDGVGNVNGGNVNFVVAPGAGVDIVIVSIMPLDQQTVYPTNDKFPAKVHEDAIDKLTMICQQLAEVDQRTLKLALTSLQKNPVLADLIAGKTLRVKGDGSGIEMVDATSGGSLTLPLPVVDGGTGLASHPSGAYIKGAGAGALTSQAVPIPVADGGTGVTTVDAALSNLGLAGARLAAYQNF